MNNKLFLGLADRFMKLCEQHTDLYFKERPWLETPKIKHIVTSEELMKNNTLGNFYWVDAPHTLINCSEERIQVELEMRKVSEKMDTMVAPSVPADDKTIEYLFGPITT